jgi:single-stranded-DNA-specific exonuclease
VKQAVRRWVIREADAGTAARLAEEVGVSPVTAQVLLHRGIDSGGAARAFLQPSLNGLHDPCGLPDAEKAAERIHEAAKRGEQIVVYGDYDADGITATAVLIRCLHLMGAQATHYIPDRLEEGYGLNAQAIRGIIAGGAKLIITADCGITAVEEVRIAQEAGVDVIVSDHHEAGPHFAGLLDAAHSVVSTMREDSTYPFESLSGVGVAFKLAWALGKKASGGQRCSGQFQEFLIDAVSLVALGTIADVVPLVGENRIFASYGLTGLSHSANPGIRALRQVAGIDGRNLTAFDVAFKLGPRLNAAGRLGAAGDVVNLFTTSTPEKAAQVAEFLDSENVRRQKIQEEILDQALAQLEAGPPVENLSVIVLAAEGWHPGVVGVVSAKLVERFWLPALVLSVDGDEVHGSGRSIEGVCLYEALAECEDLLTAFGGHELAAGLRLKRSNLEQFRERFGQAVARRMTEENRVPALHIDAETPLVDLSLPCVQELQRLQPFGQGNREPVFAARDLRVAGQVRRLGTKGNHLAFYVQQGDTSLRAIAFGRGLLADALQKAGMCSLAYAPTVNSWNGSRSVELRVEDILLGGAAGVAP